MRTPTRWLAIALIALFSPAFAAGEPIQVTAPADGTVLRGGELATISWVATGPLREGVVEWEAFLSVNGGRYYATRITPHLDIDIRTFEWRVPNVASNDVKLMLRVGDEREETSVDVPLRFSIVAEPRYRPSQGIAFGRERGESARPGDPAVVEWVTGDRGGTHLGHQRAPQRDTAHAHKVAHTATTHAVAHEQTITTSRIEIASTATIAIASGAKPASLLLSRDILLLVRRRNI